MSILDDPDDDILAAEYVLRLLEGDDLRVAQTRARQDDGFARLVLQWRERFEPLDDEYVEIKPRAATKTAIMSTLFAADDAPAIWGKLRFWRFATAAICAIAIGLGTLIALERTSTERLIYVTEIVSENDDLRMLAVYDPQNEQLRITRTSGDARAGRSLQLWGILPGANPVSIAVLPTSAEATLTLPPELATQLGDLVLAVSDEPLNGSPTGQPTGDVLAVGEVSEL